MKTYTNSSMREAFMKRALQKYDTLLLAQVYIRLTSLSGIHKDGMMHLNGFTDTF